MILWLPLLGWHHQLKVSRKGWKNWTRDALFANKCNLKEKSTKDLGFSSENSIFINESLSFNTKKCPFNAKSKCRTLGYSRIITDNGTIKVKTISSEGVSKWVKIITRKDLDKLSWSICFLHLFEVLFLLHFKVACLLSTLQNERPAETLTKNEELWWWWWPKRSYEIVFYVLFAYDHCFVQ